MMKMDNSHGSNEDGHDENEDGLYDNEPGHNDCEEGDLVTGCQGIQGILDQRLQSGTSVGCSSEGLHHYF